MRLTGRQAVRNACLVVALAGFQGILPSSAAAGHRSLAVEGTPGSISREATPSVRRGAFQAKIFEATRLYDRPEGSRTSVRAFPLTKYSRFSTRLLVTAGKYASNGRLWVELEIPSGRPHSRGWIEADRVRITHSDWFVRVRLSRRAVTVYRKGQIIRRWKAVVGAPETPTPTGLFATYENVAAVDTRGFTGPWALHLTAKSRVLDRFGAGDGRIAIHGRGAEALADPLGTARSHGCIRISNRNTLWLRRNLVAGTPVSVTRS